ncbi:MAG: META domain-containing protein, partial [Prevotella stercorea]|nr:META domain-containing protein [Leyella stercorea]
MKKISIIAAAIALCSCSATKTTDAAVDLNGEWDIVTVDG